MAPEEEYLVTSSPSRLLVVSPDPTVALARLDGAVAALEVDGEARALPGHDHVLLSGDVAPEVVRQVAATRGGTTALVVGIDLANPPAPATLAELQDWHLDHFVRWGDLPVAVATSAGNRAVEPGLVAALSSLVTDPGQAATEREALLETAVQHADDDRSRLTDQVGELRRQLAAERSRVAETVRERDEARAAEHALRRQLPVRLHRLAGRVARRLPGGRAGLLAVAAGGLVVLATGAVLLASTASTEAAVATGVGLVLALNVLLSLLLLGRVDRLAQDGHAARQHLWALQKSQRRTGAEVARVHRRLDNQRELLRRTRTAVADVRKVQGGEKARRAVEHRRLLAQVQDTVRLFGAIPTTARIPSMGGWAASPDLVSVLVDEFVQRRPSLVVECGSGVSTLWLALAARHHGIPTRIVSLDHDAAFAEQTRATLEQHGVADIAEVRHAPLLPVQVEGRDWRWYARAASADLQDIGLLFVDGPPKATGPLARYPALPVLKDQFAASCSIVLDDMIREDEQEIVARWHDALPEFTRTDPFLEKGATILRRG